MSTVDPLAPTLPGQPRPLDVDPSTCGLCGHPWHGLRCPDEYGPTGPFPWSSLRGHVCNCPSSFRGEGSC